ncbi:AMP-binding protein [Brevundimonas sp. Root1279]|uniref:AMP-binding protein n=1 Tax=Brevundimonas sp. Root1279 TaxID=1736443 RepID=UPI0006F3D848|nr:AMP-binding protein [Brevundimonas sp. Root1279]KQW86838.1 AMP-dependent synthetase [Brevundimonas sp. Root1279]
MIDGEMQAFALTLDKFLDHAAKWHPNVEVVTAHEGERVVRTGYAEIRRRALKVSGVLEGLGVRCGDRVATLAWNTQSHVEAWYAIMGMGAVCHTLNPRLTETQLAAMVSQSEARILIASADLAPLARRVADRTRSLERVLVIDGAAGSDEDVDALEGRIAADGPDGVWGGFDETTPCGLCFTSGTTGAPKGVTYTHRSSSLHTLRQLQADVMGLGGGDTVLTAVPMFHANAWGLPFAGPAVGARLVLPGRELDGARLARLINSEKVTVAVGIATVWLGLVEHLETHGGDTPSLKRVLVGGAPMAPALMERIEARLGATVQMSWGMTELSPLGVCAAPGDPGRSPQVSGRPAFGVDLLLTDAEGRPLADQRGGEGHLRVRGASVVERYFGQADSATDDDGWFPTGDLARIDPDGDLVITGRAKDLIKSGGEWINPAEIEAIVNEHPSVSLAAVIGRSDAKWGERPVLVIQTRETGDASDEDVLAPLRGRVAPWWIPDEIIRLDRMPLASTGKIDKMRLRVEYGGS